MTNQSYDYEARAGVRPISWEDFHALCKGLARAAARFAPEIILAVGRGGYYPGTLIAHMLQAEIYPVRLSRRVNDVIAYETPQWLLRPPALVAGRRVLVVDEISSTGETLRMVAAEAERMGAGAVRSAVLYAHTRGATTPDYIGLVSDALLLNPWDREIFKDGAFRFHPEYVDALAKQGVTPGPDLRIAAEIPPIAKGQ
ncbi:MAG: hypothetical protein Kow00120_28720 [Anaerolineae bacterium]